MYRNRQHNILRKVLWCSILIILGFIIGTALRQISLAPTTPQHTESLPVDREALPSPNSPPRPVSPADSPNTGQDPADTTQTGPEWTRITIHHTVTPTNGPTARVLSIDADHRRRGWDGVGYHFLIAEDGRFWHGRPLSKQGAHVLGENEGNIGIAFIGTYEKQPPPEAALNACRALLRTLQDEYHIPDSRIYFHSELKPTECPGSWDKSILFRGRGER